MTTEEKRNEIREKCDATPACATCPLYEKIPKDECCYENDANIERNYDIMFGKESETSEEPCIKDSGERREFDTGAVRDIQEGKGRCDLMPLDVVAEYMPDTDVLHWIAKFMEDNDTQHLWEAFDLFQYRGFPIEDVVTTKQRMANTLLEVAKHFEEGAKKYGEYNWQKGIPTHCYIDSAVRHYLKWLRGDKDEPHDRAFCWNILCCIWTCNHKPELNDYGKDKTNDSI